MQATKNYYLPPISVLDFSLILNLSFPERSLLRQRYTLSGLPTFSTTTSAFFIRGSQTRQSKTGEDTIISQGVLSRKQTIFCCQFTTICCKSDSLPFLPLLSHPQTWRGTAPCRTFHLSSGPRQEPEHGFGPLPLTAIWMPCQGYDN